VYSVHKSIVKKEFRYEFWLKMIRDYYYSSVYEMRAKYNLEETRWPYLVSIDDAADILKNEGTANLLNHKMQKKNFYKSKIVAGHRPARYFFASLELDDIIAKPDRETDVDP